MLTAVAFIPGAPLMVPELSGPGAAADTDPLRTAVLLAATELADVTELWIAIGAVDAAREKSWTADTPGDDSRTAVPRSGTFAGFGVDVRVSLDPTAPDEHAAHHAGAGHTGAGHTGARHTDGRHTDAWDPAADTMPTPMLVAGWVRGSVAPGNEVRPVVIDAAATPQQCREQGAALAEHLRTEDRRVGVLAIADGSTGLTAKAPSGLLPGAPELQEVIDDAVGGGDLAALAALDPTRCAEGRVTGRAVWQTVAALCTATENTSPRPRTLYRAAPFGVGYHVARWDL